MRVILGLWFVLVFGLVAGCRTSAHRSELASMTHGISIAGTFSPSSPSTEAITDIILPLADRIPHQVKAIVVETASGGRAEVWQVEFFLEDEAVKRKEQISFLRDLYQTPYRVSSERDQYFMKDFLPPAMAAVLNHGFDEQSQTLRGLLGGSDLDRDPMVDNFVLQPKIKTLTNCWTTAYEILRQRDDHFMTFFASDLAVLPYLGYPGAPAASFNDDASPYSQFIKELPWQQACVPGERRSCPQGDLFEQRNEGLEPGDVLLVYKDSKTLMHAAIMVDHDFYFERTGAKGKNYLYRLVPFSQIAKDYSEPELKFRYRRFRGAEQELPDPLAVFGQTGAAEKAVWQLMPESLRAAYRPALQPEVGDARDLGIYEFKDHPIKANDAGTFTIQK